MRRGFTLVEVLLAIGLMTATAGIGLARYMQYSRQQAVRTTADQLISAYNQAKSNAAAGVKDCSAAACGGVNDVCDSGVGDLPLTSWRVTLNPGGTSGYRIEGVCVGRMFMSRTVSFSGGVGVAYSQQIVNFLPLGQETDSAGQTVTVSRSGATSVVFNLDELGGVKNYACYSAGVCRQACEPGETPSVLTCPAGAVCCTP